MPIQSKRTGPGFIGLVLCCGVRGRRSGALAGRPGCDCGPAWGSARRVWNAPSWPLHQWSGACPWKAKQQDFSLVFFLWGIPPETFLCLHPGTTHALFISSALNIQVLQVTHGNTKRLLMFHRVCQLKPTSVFYLKTTHLSVDYAFLCSIQYPCIVLNSAKQNKTHIKSRAQSTQIDV